MPRGMQPTAAEEAGRLARRTAEKIQEHGWTRHVVRNQLGEVCLMGGVMTAAGLANGMNNVSHPKVRNFALHFAGWLGSSETAVPHSVLAGWNDGEVPDIGDPPRWLAGITMASPQTQQDLLDVLAKFSAELDPRGESDAARNPQRI